MVKSVERIDLNDEKKELRNVLERKPAKRNASECRNTDPGGEDALTNVYQRIGGDEDASSEISNHL